MAAVFKIVARYDDTGDLDVQSFFAGKDFGKAYAGMVKLRKELDRLIKEQGMCPYSPTNRGEYEITPEGKAYLSPSDENSTLFDGEDCS